MVDQHLTDRKGTFLILKEGGLSLHLFYLFIYLTRTAVPQPGEIVEPDCAERDSVPWTLEQKSEPLTPSPRLLRGQSLSSTLFS